MATSSMATALLLVVMISCAGATNIHGKEDMHHGESGFGSGKAYRPEYDDDTDWEMDDCESKMCPLTAFLCAFSMILICVFRCFKVRCRCCPNGLGCPERCTELPVCKAKCGSKCKQAGCSSKCRVPARRRDNDQTVRIVIRPGTTAMV
jgi:hypothetical protein